jgi:hypothetical protein
MKYEVIERTGIWLVQEQGVEVGRFERQALALDEVTRRLQNAPVGESVGLSMRFQQPTQT